MNLTNTNKIKPDPNQPRRTFNKEKMDALEASMKKDGFRTAYPIVVDDKFTIVDGERRWKTAKKLKIKQVPVEIKEDITDWERLLYQLQSEGVEFETLDKYEAWTKLYDLAKPLGYGYDTLSKNLGINETTFKKSVLDFKRVNEVSKRMGFDSHPHFHAVAEVARIDDQKLQKKVVKKAVKENWSVDKSRDIRKAIKEYPHREKEILSRDYSDPVNEEGETMKGSTTWKDRLKVATMDIDLDQVRKDGREWKEQESTFDAYDVIITSSARLRTALDKFDYKIVAPHVRVTVHKELSRLFPGGTTWLKGLEDYMINEGEITGNKKQLK